MMGKDSSVMKAWEATVKKTQAVAKKRANSIFGSIHMSHHVDEDDNKDEQNESTLILETYQAERVLPNGDYYTGEWSDSFPHGKGKYIWSDGCTYVGEWFQGKTMGMGRFTWPLGPSYEGEFKSGYMDGNGTYTTSNGDSYQGQWVMNLKHGHGVMSYANGDRYKGEWRRGLQDGQGSYQWNDGNHYVGEWRNGTICGKGSFVWGNGNRYDGYWEDCLPKGSGTFKWPNGSFYVGNWSKDPSDQNGTYYPTGSSQEGHLEWDPQEVFSELNEYQIYPGEKVTILPSQKRLAVWRSSKGGDSGKPRRRSVDGRVSVGLEKPTDKMQIWGEGDFGGNQIPTRTSALDEELLALKVHTLKAPRKLRKQGETICKGHKNYELMLNLQLGIRHSVGRPAPSASFDLKPSAFDPKERMWTRFPPEGSKYTPPHQSSEFKWKDYCPVVFRVSINDEDFKWMNKELKERTLRRLFKVDPGDYMLSICGNDALRELSSPGKSGSFFYLTNDDRYMIKTMKKAEAKALLRMLPAYYNHFRAFENSLLTKFYGLHCVKLTGPSQKKVRFIIMGNLFCSEYAIHKRFDLKGSSLGRITDKLGTEISEITILKDLDLNFIFRLQRSWFQEFSRQIDKDCELLEQEGIMDYSLLVGIHFKDISIDGDLMPSRSQPLVGDLESEGTPYMSRADMDQLLLDPSRWASIKLGVNMPARVERTVRKSDCELQILGNPIGEFYEVVLFFGIIDILQDYDINKKLEHAYKSIQYDSISISAVDPRQYSKRFRDFIFRIFSEDS